MALDTIAAKSAQSLLNGIDYSALIGGPLEAAIKAQAMAAQSTWTFIQEVGLNKSPRDGTMEARNVSFVYQKDGQQVKLIVPILTIVPIPLIIIDEVNIEFKANISASASQTTEDSSSEEVAAEASAEAKIGWGPFSLSARFQASYSSKKDSKATQDSRYSVEYTQDVRIHASQAGMPAGLSTVLNILSNAATGASVNGKLAYSPMVGTLSAANPDIIQNLTVSVQDGNGLNLQDHPVTVTVGEARYQSALRLALAPLRKALPWGAGGGSNEIVVNTDDSGQLGLMISLDPKYTDTLPGDGIIFLNLESEVDGKPRQASFGIRVAGVETVMDIDPNPVNLTKGATTGKAAEVSVTHNGVPVNGKKAKVRFYENYTGVTAKVKVGGSDVDLGNTDKEVDIANGKFSVSDIKAASTATVATARIVLSYEDVTEQLTLNISA